MRKFQYTPEAKVTYGGKLITGTYVCNEVVYTGSKVESPFGFRGKGFFQLMPNKTLRWLKNGGGGRCRYDAAKGNITWLSGYFKSSEPARTLFRPNGEIIVRLTSADLQELIRNL